MNFEHNYPMPIREWSEDDRPREKLLGDSYCLYMVWDPLENADTKPIRIQNPAKKLDHAKREIIAARFFEIPAEALVQAASVHGGTS